MPGPIRIALRMMLVVAGFVLCGTGFAELTIPEALHSEDVTRRARAWEVVGGFGFVGYGLLLVLPPRWLLVRPLLWILVAAMLALIVCGLVAAIEAGRGVLHLFLFFAPAAGVAALVRAESRQPNTTQQPTSAPSGAGG